MSVSHILQSVSTASFREHNDSGDGNFRSHHARAGNIAIFPREATSAVWRVNCVVGGRSES